MDINTFTISEIMFMVDIIKLDKKNWCLIGDDKDVINEYDSIIAKLENRLADYHGMNKAMRSLISGREKLFIKTDLTDEPSHEEQN